MTAPVRNTDKKKLDHQVFLSHFKPVYIGLWFFPTWSLIYINWCHIKHFHHSKSTCTRRISKCLRRRFSQYAIIFHTVNCVLFINRPNLTVFVSTFRLFIDCPCTRRSSALLLSRFMATSFLRNASRYMLGVRRSFKDMNISQYW
jgi:hypothetical protein